VLLSSTHAQKLYSLEIYLNAKFFLFGSFQILACRNLAVLKRIRILAEQEPV